MIVCCGQNCLWTCIAVAKQALRASVERYSLKDLEIFYNFERKMPLREVTPHIHALQRTLELSRSDTISEETQTSVAAYNRDDCISTMHLRDWLEELRRDLTNQGYPIPRPALQSGDPTEILDQHQERIRALSSRLTGDISPDPNERTDDQQARWILANLLAPSRTESGVVGIFPPSRLIR